MANDKKFRSALEIFGEEYINELAKQLQNAGKRATGTLIGSLDYRVQATGFGTKYTIVILAEEYLQYVDEGRRPGGKQPPLESIRAWTVVKGIDPDLAFPIAKKIAEDGIKATHVIQKALDKMEQNQSYEQLEQGAADWASDLIDDALLEISKNGNITVS